MLPGAAAGRAADRSRRWRRSGLRVRRRWILGVLLSAAVTLVSVVAILRRGERGAANAVRATACAAKARTKLAEGDPRDALHWAELALALDASSRAAHRLAGGARAALGDLTRAFDLLETTAGAAPDDAEAALSAGLAARLLARNGGGSSYDEAARTWLGRAIERADRAAARLGDAAVPRFVGAAACIALQDPDGAIARLGGVRPRDDAEVEQVAVLRAAAEASAGRPDVALSALDDAIGAAASPAAAAARARLVEMCTAYRETLRERALRSLAAAKPEDAVALLAEWLREHHGDAVGLAGLATALQAARRGSECEEVRAALLRRGGPGSADAATWFWAHVRRAAGDPRGAMECLEALRMRDPRNEAVLAAVVACADEAGDPLAGVAAAETSAGMAPGHPGIAALLGVARERVGDVDGAMGAYRAAIRLAATEAPVVDPPTTAATSRPTATFDARTGGRRDSAARRLAVDRLADLLLRIGRSDEALAALDAVGDRGKATVRRAAVLLATGRVADAEAEFRAVAAAAPNCAAAHVGIARTAWLRGDEVTARAALDAALGADPESVDAWTTLFATARDAEASAPHDARLAAAILARPRSAALAFVAGVVAERRGEFDAAARHYRASLAIAPRSVAARNNLAWVLATALGRPSEARRIADGALADAPTSPQVLDTAGWARFLDGDPAGAEPLLARAVRASPASGAVALRHARVLAALSRTHDARRAIDDAVAADPALHGTPDHETALAAVSVVPATATPAPGPIPSESEVPR